MHAQIHSHTDREQRITSFFVGSNYCHLYVIRAANRAPQEPATLLYIRKWVMNSRQTHGESDWCLWKSLDEKNYADYI